MKKNTITTACFSVPRIFSKASGNKRKNPINTPKDKYTTTSSSCITKVSSRNKYKHKSATGKKQVTEVKTDQAGCRESQKKK